MADQTFEPGTEWPRVLGLFVLGVLCLGGAAFGPAGYAVPLVPMGILFVGFAVYHCWYTPYLVTLTEQAVILRARARQIVIPWADLYSIEVRPNRYSSQLRWAFGRGKVVQLTAEFNGLTSMLTEIRRRSPGTALP